MRAMLRRLTRAACISVHAPDGSHSYVAIFFILVLPNTYQFILQYPSLLSIVKQEANTPGTASERRWGRGVPRGPGASAPGLGSPAAWRRTMSKQQVYIAISC